MNAPDAVDVVALGESMVTFLPGRPGRLADVPSFSRAIGGAESNVACGLAAMRLRGAVGQPGRGRRVRGPPGRDGRGYGVDTSAVGRDSERPTGVYFRTAGDRGTDGHEVAYYRAGSAASAMSVENVDLSVVRAGRVLHLSGITAALSSSCLELVRELMTPAVGRPLVSFDVNHRAGLWRDADGPRVLLELARGADIVYVGEDEAEEVWGVTGGPAAVRAVLPEPSVLVVKQGGRGATAFVSDAAEWGLGAPRGGAAYRCSPAPLESVTWASALDVDVVATTGAGDAFAAGFLSATLRDLPLRDRLRHGHLWAAAALTVPGDLAVPPSRAHADRLVALGDDAWGRLRLGPGWTQVGTAPEEVRTP